MRKKIKNEVKKPARHRDYFEVVVEEIKDKLGVIIEGQTVMTERFDRKFDEAEVRFDKFEQQTNGNFKTVFSFMDKTENNFKTVFSFNDEIRSNFKTVFGYLSRIDDEIKDIKSEIKKLKEELKGKPELVRLETLEIRVARMEEEMAHRS